VVSSTARPHFTPGKDPVAILQEAGWAPGPLWTGGKSRSHRDSIQDRPAELPGQQIFNIDVENKHTALLTFRELSLIKGIFSVLFIFVSDIHSLVKLYYFTIISIIFLLSEMQLAGNRILHFGSLSTFYVMGRVWHPRIHTVLVSSTECFEKRLL